MPLALARRFGWLAKTTLVRIALALLCVGVPYILVATLARDLAAGPAARAAGACLTVLAVLGGYFGYVRWIEQRAVRELSTGGCLREMALGLALGAALFAITIGVLASLGMYHVDGNRGLAVVLATIPALVTGAVLEELLFRAVIFRLLEAALGSWIALALSAALFGALHHSNPGATGLSSVAIGLEAGALLAAAYMLTGRLWFCTALHFGWNFAQGSIFSVAVSGYQQQGFFKARLAGPEWLTGGQFGAEASVVALFACMALAACLLARAVQLGRIVAPGWRRRRNPPRPATAHAEAA